MRRADRTLPACLIVIGLCAVMARDASAQLPSEWGGVYRRGSSRLQQSFERDIFPGNTFTFCRVIYSNSWGYGTWRVDFPDSDINFSMRLAELTTIRVNYDDEFKKEYGNPDGIVHSWISLTNDELFNYPILYMLEVGSLEFSQAEVERLRQYLLRGGFLHVDDFWGDSAWRNWEYEIGKVFPPEEFPIRDIPLDHQLFRIVFNLDEVPQAPSISHWLRTGGGTAEYHDGDTSVAHCRGIWDKNGRLMVVMTHNTDLGDGWEREAENPDYFAEISVKKAYPLGINIVVYAMTH